LIDQSDQDLDLTGLIRFRSLYRARGGNSGVSTQGNLRSVEAVCKLLVMS